MNKFVFVGYLRNISDMSFYLDDDSGNDWVKVTFDSSHDTPINVKLAIDVYKDENGELRINPEGKYYDLI